MYSFLRTLLFLFPPETAHHLTLKFIRWIYQPYLAKRCRKRLPKRPINLFGLLFPNPIGLAAGMDKDGECLDAWFAMGFGFIEVGTVTPKPQAGNPKPRLFRLVSEKGLINRMGFNNEGVDVLVKRLQQRRVEGIIGVNIGKNRDTPLIKAVDDYRYCFSKVYPYADYVTVNISSPNTPGLRELQGANYLDHLLLALMQTRDSLEKIWKRQVPLLVKISPDLTEEELKVMVDIFKKHNVDGIIATNTSIDRSAISHLKAADEKGGLSGKPIFQRAKKIIEHLFRLTQGAIPIIAVGGIDSPEDAKAMLSAGASAVQLYTGFIYEGPSLVSNTIKLIDQTINV